MNLFLQRKNIIFFVFVLGLLALSFLYNQKPDIQAASSDNVSGWAWSENIGWVSFNSTNQGGGASYGVQVAQNGDISGYAWSENIGWISFNENSGCPQAPCKPKMNKGTGEITGWTRACGGTTNGDCTGGTRSDGWDGWIHLKGTNYGVTVSGCSWQGYAWGSDVLGWLNFKGANYGVTGSGNACRQIGIDIKANNSDGPITIPYNTATTLSWASENAASCTASGSWSDSKPLSGSQSTGNLTSSQTYTLTCSGIEGQKSDSVTVNVLIPPPSTSFSASPSSIFSGQSSTLSWSSSLATSCSIDQDIGNVVTSGSQPVSPTITTTYILTCIGAGGQTNKSATVSVNSCTGDNQCGSGFSCSAGKCLKQPIFYETIP